MDKGVKRKLIMEIGSQCKSPAGFPKEYTHSRFQWSCDIIAESDNGVVNEYTIAPDRKIFLQDFLDIMRSEIKNIIDDEAMNWAVKIYRLTPTKR